MKSPQPKPAIELKPVTKPDALISGFYHSITELQQAEVEEFDEVLPGLRRGQVNMMVSVTNVGKTTLALNLALSAASGRAFPPFTTEDGEPRKVMFIDGEATLGELRDDLTRMLESLENPNIADENFFPLVEATIRGESLILSKKEHLDYVIGKARQWKADLIVIDTFGALFDLRDENSNAEVSSTVMRPLKALAQAASASVLGNHHQGKPNESGNIEIAYRGRGASAFGGLARTIFCLARANEMGEDYVQLTVAKAKGQMDFKHALLRLNHERRWFEHCDETGNKQQPKVTLTAQEVENYVREKGEARTSDIASHFKSRASERTVRNRIERAVKAGLINREGKGKPWRIGNGKPL